MLRKLKKRPRSDKHVNQDRKLGGNWGRRVYLALLFIFALTMINYLWGDLLFLRFAGLVLQDKTVVAVSYVARIEAVEVSEGQTVHQGQTLLRIASMDVLERIADLSIRQAELTQRAAELKLRSDVAMQMQPLAERREEQTDSVLRQFDMLGIRGLVTSARYNEILLANFDAREDRIKFAAESETLSMQIADLEAARRDSMNAIRNLEAHYADGVVRARLDGSIGAQIPSVGDVYRAGEPILSVYSGDAHVLAYLPSRYLFPIRPGMEVTVSSGRYRDDGVITEILPVSDALPLEFQNTFEPRERNQLAKIHLSDPSQFPVSAKVEVTRKIDVISLICRIWFNVSQTSGGDFCIKGDGLLKKSNG